MTESYLGNKRFTVISDVIDTNKGNDLLNSWTRVILARDTEKNTPIRLEYDWCADYVNGMKKGCKIDNWSNGDWHCFANNNHFGMKVEAPKGISSYDHSLISDYHKETSQKMFNQFIFAYENLVK